MNDLTRELKHLITLMYKEMLCRQDTLGRDKANYFSNSNEIRDIFLPNASEEYVSELCWKLKSKGYISCLPGDNLANHIKIEDKTVIYFENKFGKNLSAIAEFLLKIK